MSVQSNDRAFQGDESPIAVLAEEHALILRALDVFEKGLAGLESGASVGADVFGSLAGFFRDFADRYHHGKEEEILFDHMVNEMEFARRSGPVAVLSSEHEVGRARVRAIAHAADALDKDPAAARRLIEEGRAYIALLRSHIEREDHKVFLAVEDFLGPDERAALMAAFSRFEAAEGGAGTSAKYAALIEQLAN